MATIHSDRILYEDDALLVVNKLAGELVVKAPGEGKRPLYDFLHKDYPGLRVVHRLDFATSGVVVFAKSAAIAKTIRESKFKDWVKTYRLLCSGRIELKQGTIKRKLPARSDKELIDAETTYRVLALFPKASFVEATIETGRKHQIRKHFQFIGHPLLLDPLYGDARVDRAFKKHFRYRRFFLHAYVLDFPHPVTGKMLHIQAPLPQAFEDVLAKLRQAK